jgi:hypothetical protein
MPAVLFFTALAEMVIVVGFVSEAKPLSSEMKLQR